jgi:hypothetical protein
VHDLLAQKCLRNDAQTDLERNSRYIVQRPPPVYVGQSLEFSPDDAMVASSTRT